MIRMDTEMRSLPFKGKGGVRQRLRQLERQRTEVETHMRQLAAAYQRTFRAPRVAHLVVHAQGGYVHLRWRASARGGAAASFFELTTSAQGQQVLNHLPALARALCLNFEQQRLALNLAAILAQHEQRRLREYLAKWDALRACHGANPG